MTNIERRLIMNSSYGFNPTRICTQSKEALNHYNAWALITKQDKVIDTKKITDNIYPNINTNLTTGEINILL